MMAKRIPHALFYLPRRAFINSLQIDGVTEEILNNRINISSRQFFHSESLQFDPLGRYLLYDCVPFTLKSRSGVLNSLFTAATYYATYLFYFADPYN